MPLANEGAVQFGKATMKIALAVGMASGAIAGFIVGVKFESQVLRDLGLFQSISRNGIDGPFLGLGGLFAGIGGLVGISVVHVFRLRRAV